MADKGEETSIKLERPGVSFMYEIIEDYISYFKSMQMIVWYTSIMD